VLYNCSPAQDLAYRHAKKVFDSVIVKLNKYYVFSEVAKQMEVHLHKQLVSKQYDTVGNETLFANLLTADLRKISNDKHLHVNFSAAVLPPAENNSPSEMPEGKKTVCQMTFA
jgi:hypothetical protein